MDNQSKYILEMKMSHRFLGLPPQDNIETIPYPIFYKDQDDGFKVTTLMGTDILLLISDSMILCATDLITGNTAISLMVVLLYQFIVVFYRNQFGEANISKKTLIDERFLI
jgi:Meckelin (Transmembrane protein 67)